MRFNTIKIPCTESTNADLKAMAARGAEIGTTLVAERQSAGRGRLGRSFASETGGLYMSVILPYQKSDTPSLVTVSAAVAVSRAIERLAPLSVEVKWVNDLLADGKKICGILAEAVTVGEESRAVLGIGINLTNKLPRELSDIAANIYDLCGRVITPEAMLEAALDEISRVESESFEDVLEEYRHKCVTLGKIVDVIPHDGEKYKAKAVDILHDGALLVEKEETREKIRVFSGEVSTRISENNL